MSWKILLKRRIETLADYTNASPEERAMYHSGRQSVYRRRLMALRNSIAHLGETNPNIPLEEDMRELQEMRNFHSRQEKRITNNSSMPDYFSPELEEQRMKIKLQTTPRGLKNPRPDLTIEEYEALNENEKMKYHDEKRGYGKAGANPKDARFHRRMLTRLRKKSNLPTYPTPDSGDEMFYGLTYTKEQYDNMSREDKTNYHTRMLGRFRRKNNKELEKFHRKMYGRLLRNSPLPAFYSPEHEEEE